MEAALSDTMRDTTIDVYLEEQRPRFRNSLGTAHSLSLGTENRDFAEAVASLDQHDGGPPTKKVKRSDSVQPLTVELSQSPKRESIVYDVEHHNPLRNSIFSIQSEGI